VQGLAGEGGGVGVVGYDWRKEEGEEGGKEGYEGC
jgi:hypothetical protein